jgi:glycine/D-amino acid oxidase-like deaminating enzyme
VAVDDLDLAVYSPNDAWIDPYAALMGFRAKARAQGVAFVAGGITGWDRDRVTLADGTEVVADTFVLACGAWSREVAALIGLDLPVEPMSRESYVFKAEAEIEPLPFLKSESDLAIRPEGDGYVGGVPDWSEPAGWNFELDPDRFEAVVWPALARRVPKMERLKLMRSWRGHYARSILDYSPIIGRWSDGLENVVIATGFSGHGIMHAPATGRAVTELILGGRFETLDLTCFGWERIPANRPYREQGMV